MRGVRAVQGLPVALTVVAWLMAYLCANDVHADDSRATQVLAAAKASLGGMALDAIRSLRAEGRGSRIVGSFRFAAGVRLEVVRPDRFVRTDRLSVGATSAETGFGFNGSDFIQRVSGLGDVSPGLSALAPVAAAGLRHDVRMLLLGVFAAPFDGSAIETAYAGVAEAPDGKADAIAMTFDDGTTATLFIDAGTLLPRMVSWQAPDPLSAVKSTPSGVTAEVRPDNLIAVEHRVAFADYRTIKGVRFPFLIRRSVAGELSEELKFDSVELNAAIDERTFQVAR